MHPLHFARVCRLCNESANQLICMAARFLLLPTPSPQVYSIDVVSEATGARWISFRRFREFDVLYFIPVLPCPLIFSHSRPTDTPT